MGEEPLLAYVGKVGGDRYDPVVFEPDSGLVEADIELSDEMVILRAEDARLLKEPPWPTRIEVRPSSAKIRLGGTFEFAASCFDQHGRPLTEPAAAWSATGGTIDERGCFTAEELGVFRVEAKIGSLGATAEVRVEDGIIIPSPPPPPSQGFAWKGSVPPQKWMNFYTKVLSSLVAIPGLKLEVRFVVPAGDAVTESKVEATRSALRELGLSEDLETR